MDRASREISNFLMGLFIIATMPLWWAGLFIALVAMLVWDAVARLGESGFELTVWLQQKIAGDSHG